MWPSMLADATAALRRARSARPACEQALRLRSSSRKFQPPAKSPMIESSSDPLEGDLHIDAMLYAYCTRVHSTTWRTPYSSVFGRPANGFVGYTYTARTAGAIG